MRSNGKLVVASGFASLRGRRDANEDYCAVYCGTATEQATHGIAAAVADGLGGAKGGRVAAELAVRSFVDGYFAAPATLGVAGAATAALGGYNRWLHSMARHDANMEGAATTFTGLVLRGRRAHVLHVGDSRAWLFRDGMLTRLTEDHALSHPDMRHVLYRALGLERGTRFDHAVQELAVHDRLLLTSDGVHGTLGERAIERLLAARGAPEADAEALVAAAFEAGSQDNASAVLIDVVELPAPDFDSLAENVAALPILAPPEEGDEVDGFRLDRCLSDGRYTRLFAAEDIASGRTLVLKFPKPVLLSEAGAKLAFLREIMVGSRVRSPFVGEVVLLAPDRQTRLYVALHFYEGETLESRLANGPLGVAAGLAIAAKIARGVAALHRQAIIHRDIKPENILLTADGGIRLIDLGVARLPRVEEFADAEIPGTHAYMAPELFAGDRGSEASDQFALGVVLYRIFTGRFPYGEIEPFSRPRFGRALSAGTARPELPGWLDLALARAVAVKPEERYGDVVELLAALEGGSAQAIRLVAPRSLYERNPLRFWQAVSLILALALVAALFL